MDSPTEYPSERISENEAGPLAAEDIAADFPGEESAEDAPITAAEEILRTEGEDEADSLIQNESIEFLETTEDLDATKDGELDSTNDDELEAKVEIKKEPQETDFETEGFEKSIDPDSKDPYFIHDDELEGKFEVKEELKEIDFDWEKLVGDQTETGPEESYTQEFEVQSSGRTSQGSDGQRVSFSAVEKPKYRIKEFVESAAKLKFEVHNTNTTFKLFLPTLKKIVEIPEWDKVVLKRERPEIRVAMMKARERSRQYLVEMSRRDDRMIVSEVVHILNHERARRIQANLAVRARGVVKDLTEPPQRCDPRQSFGSKKRPTEYPAMSTLRVEHRPKEKCTGARLRCARQRYNKRSDDSWLRSEQLKLIRAAKRLQNCRMMNEKLATPPQEHDPWARPSKARKQRPNIPLPQHRH